jgi:hypothetical protein
MISHDLHISEKTTVLLSQQAPQHTHQLRLAQLLHVEALVKRYNATFARIAQSVATYDDNTTEETTEAEQDTIAEETALAISATELFYGDTSTTMTRL